MSKFKLNLTKVKMQELCFEKFLMIVGNKDFQELKKIKSKDMEFKKAFRDPCYWLRFEYKNKKYSFFASMCMGAPVVSLTIKYEDENEVQQKKYIARSFSGYPFEEFKKFFKLIPEQSKAYPQLL